MPGHREQLLIHSRSAPPTHTLTLQAARLPWVIFPHFHQYTTPQPRSVPGSVLGGEAAGNLLLSGCPCWGERPWPWRAVPAGEAAVVVWGLLEDPGGLPGGGVGVVTGY